MLAAGGLADLAVTAARWNARLHCLTFSLRGDSETRGSVERFWLRGAPPAHPSATVLFQTPADLGDIGPPSDAVGRFSSSRSVTWRRQSRRPAATACAPT